MRIILIREPIPDTSHGIMEASFACELMAETGEGQIFRTGCKASCHEFSDMMLIDQLFKQINDNLWPSIRRQISYGFITVSEPPFFNDKTGMSEPLFKPVPLGKWRIE